MWKPSSLDQSVFMLALVLQAVYLFAFNFLDDASRLSFASIPFVMSVYLAARGLGTLDPRARWGLSLFFLSMPLSWSLAYLSLDSDSWEWGIVARDVAIATWTISALAFSATMNRTAILVLATVVLTGIVWITTSEPGIVFGGVPRPASFTGGYDAPHACGYAALGFFLILDGLRRRINCRKIPIVLLMAGFALYVVAYKARTAYAMGVVYFLVAEAMSRVKPGSQRVVALLGICLFVYLGLAFGIGSSSWGDLDTFSSGRLSNYIDRVNRLGSTSFWEWLFGLGPGADKFVSSIWYWAAKTSHNDFLHALIERGILGLAGFCAYYWSLFVWNRGSGTAVVLAILTSSLISVGVPNWPPSMPFFGVALGLSAISIGSEGAVRHERRRCRTSLLRWNRYPNLPSRPAVAS